MTGGADSVLSALDEGVLTITINRPQRRNALDDEAWERLHTALTRARRDDDVRAVVLTGAGGSFCSGADLAAPSEVVHPLPRIRRYNEVAMALHDLPKPSVAKVAGAAVGAGWNLALGCDLVVAEPGARFSQIFARRGLSLDMGGSWLLPRLVGMQQAKRLALLGETIDAAEAERLGLVTWVIEQAQLDAFVADLARRLAAGPPVALSQTTALLEEGVGRGLREALDAEARAQAVNLAGADGPAAFEAFLAKREPEFTGEWAGPR